MVMASGTELLNWFWVSKRDSWIYWYCKQARRSEFLVKGKQNDGNVVSIQIRYHHLSLAAFPQSSSPTFFDMKSKHVRIILIVIKIIYHVAQRHVTLQWFRHQYLDMYLSSSLVDWCFTRGTSGVLAIWVHSLTHVSVKRKGMWYFYLFHNKVFFTLLHRYCLSRYISKLIFTKNADSGGKDQYWKSFRERKRGEIVFLLCVLLWVTFIILIERRGIFFWAHLIAISCDTLHTFMFFCWKTVWIHPGLFLQEVKYPNSTNAHCRHYERWRLLLNGMIF